MFGSLVVFIILPGRGVTACLALGSELLHLTFALFLLGRSIQRITERPI